MKARWITAWIMAAALVAMSGSAGLAQGRSDRNRPQDNRDHDRRDYGRFNDRDRHSVREWYNQHSRRPPIGLRRQDRLSPSLQARLRIGGVLLPTLRSRIRPVPAALLYRLPPAPRGYRYVIIGGHICLIDRAYRVHDMIWLQIW